MPILNMKLTKSQYKFLTSKRRTELQQRINRLKKEFYDEIEKYKDKSLF